MNDWVILLGTFALLIVVGLVVFLHGYRHRRQTSKFLGNDHSEELARRGRDEFLRPIARGEDNVVLSASSGTVSPSLFPVYRQPSSKDGTVCEHDFEEVNTTLVCKKCSAEAYILHRKNTEAS